MSTAATTPTVTALVRGRPRSILTSLFAQVLVALCFGIALGVLFPDFAIGLKILSDAFLKLISMIVAPIVFCVVVHGIAGAGDLRKVGRVGVKSLVYFEVMTTIALIFGIVLAFAFGPGHGMNIDAATLDGKALSSYGTMRTSCRVLASAASFSTSFRPRRSMRWRAMTCCRCCSSPCCSASGWRSSPAKKGRKSLR
jgi:Na+/H+-dicarboxylate symporter